MNPILNTGLLIGGLCAGWMFVCGVTGWYKDPTLNLLFFLVIPIEISGLIWGLRQTAREGRNYSQQIVAGTMMAVIAGVVIVAASLAFTTMSPMPWTRRAPPIRRRRRCRRRSPASSARSSRASLRRR